MQERDKQLQHWLDSLPGLQDYTLTPASVDASFRRYYRVSQAGSTYIVMDAPPDKEDCTPYIEITACLQHCGVCVPDIIEADPGRGFLLLSDLGSRHYLDELNEQNCEQLYELAISALVRIQAKGDAAGLPAFDDTLLIREMQLFSDWLLTKHLDIDMSADDNNALAAVFERLLQNAGAQPRVFVHRDYHSRNLMVAGHPAPDNTPGILDFQDAVAGPVTYDLVSLLKDCYIKWPAEKIRQWALSFYRQCEHCAADEAQFFRQFDLMGVQRHLKASGIFARLYHRDGKPGYLRDIPRTLSYITDLGPAYPELASLVRLIEQRVAPKLEEVNAACMS